MIITYKLINTTYTFESTKKISSYQELYTSISNDLMRIHNVEYKINSIKIDNYLKHYIFTNSDTETWVFNDLEAFVLTAELQENPQTIDIGTSLDKDKLSNTFQLINSQLIHQTYQLPPREILRLPEDIIKKNIEHERVIYEWNRSLLTLMHIIAVYPTISIIKSLIKLLSKQTTATSELFILIDTPHIDLNSIISQKIRDYRSKNHYCLFINQVVADRLVTVAYTQHFELPTTKLSTLHEGNSKYFPESQTDAAIAIAKHMPNLSKIVLRGCYTAFDYNRNFDRNLFARRVFIVINSEHDIQKVIINRNEIVFQQKKQDNRIITYLRYFDIDGGDVLKQLNNIPWNDGGMKISSSVGVKLLELAQEHNLPPLPYIKDAHSLYCIEHIDSKWSDNVKIDQYYKKRCQASFPHTATFITKNPIAKSPINKVAKETNRSQLEVKGYFRNYYAFMSGTRNDNHGRGEPKALITTSPSPNLRS